jgi:RNA polymerase sigma-70 factor (ECF subfamily)
MSAAPDNDHFLKLLRAWPDKAIQLLHYYYYDSLVRLSHSKTHDEKASEDIVHEALIEVWKNHRRIGQNPELLIVPYLLTIVKNKSAAFYNKSMKLRERQLAHCNHELISDTPSRENELITAEKQNAIIRILSTFPLREKECLTLKFYQDMSNEDVAQRLKITTKAVERSVTRAYKRFRKYRFLL